VGGGKKGSGCAPEEVAPNRLEGKKSRDGLSGVVQKVKGRGLAPKGEQPMALKNESSACPPGAESKQRKKKTAPSKISTIAKKRGSGKGYCTRGGGTTDWGGSSVTKRGTPVLPWQRGKTEAG